METIEAKKSDQILEYENKYFQVYKEKVDFGNFKKEYFVAEFGSKSGILILKDNSFLMARQYRLLQDRLVWEIPGGKIEEGEDSKESAIRECEEETGIRCLNVKPLTQYRFGTDTIKGDACLFFTDEFQEVKDFEPNLKEVDMIRWFSFEEGLEMIQSGEILDHFTIIAILSYQTFQRNMSKGNE